MTKIGLAGCYGNGKTILSLTLSETTNLPRAHVESMDMLYREIYKKKKQPQDMNMSELLCMGLARFHSRVKQEARDGFISDGTVLNEIAYGKARMQMQGTLFGRNTGLKSMLVGRKYMGFSERLERTIVDHAKKAYDIIYYLRAERREGAETGRSSEFRGLFDRYFMEILTATEIKHKVLKGDIQSFAHEILSDLRLAVPARAVLARVIAEKERAKNQLPREFQFGK